MTYLRLCPVFLFSLTISISACSLLTDADPTQSPDSLSETPQAPPALIERTTHSFERPRAIRQPAVEIVWKGPAGKVDRYVINYGYEESALGNKIDLQVQNLEQYEDPEYGQVFRYYLTETDPNKDLYFNIQAVTDDILSEPSRIMRVASEMQM